MISPSLRNPVMNQLQDPNLIPMDKRKFDGWQTSGGDTVTVTQGQTVSEWGTTQATRIQTSGGTLPLKYHWQVTAKITGSLVVKIKNNGTTNLKLRGVSGGASQVFAPGVVATVRLAITDDTPDLRFETNDSVNDSLDFYAFEPVAVVLPITSFNFSRPSCAFTPSGAVEMPNNMRFAAGKFGMGGMIEEGVTNLIPADKQKFEGWAVYQGATVTLTQNVTVPEWSTDKATRIQTNGGTHVVKYFLVVLTSVNGQAYTETIRVKNSGTADMIVGNFLGATATIQAGQSADVAITSTGNGSSQLKIECRATTATDNLDFIAYQPMATATAYPLTFTDSTRAAEVMTLPTAGIWTPGNWQVDMVVTPITATVITGVYRRAFSIKTDANNWIDCMVNATGRLYVAVTSGGAQNHTSNVGDVVLETGKNYPATFKGNGSTIAMFVNGVKGLAGDKAYSEPLGALPSFMTFGCLEDKTLYANFIYEHIRIGTARPDAEIIASHAATSNPFPIDALTTAKIDFNAITYRRPKVVNL